MKKTVEKKTAKTTEQPPMSVERKLYKLDDSLIATIREILQLAIITGSNIVDHLRSVVVEPDEIGTRLVPCPEYIESYNKMITALAEEAEQKMRENLREQEAQEETTPLSKKSVN